MKLVEIARLLEDAREAGYTLADLGGFVTYVIHPNNNEALIIYPDNVAFKINPNATVNHGMTEVSEMYEALGLQPRSTFNPPRGCEYHGDVLEVGCAECDKLLLGTSK